MSIAKKIKNKNLKKCSHAFDDDIFNSDVLYDKYVTAGYYFNYVSKRPISVSQQIFE